MGLVENENLFQLPLLHYWCGTVGTGRTEPMGASLEEQCPELRPEQSRRVVEGMARVLKQAGYRLTQPRLAVLKVLQKNNGYLSPAEIYERGRALYPSLGLVTVYRTLEMLDELGLVRRVHGRGDCHGYARADSASGHYLLCHQCGQVAEFPCEGMEGIIEAVQRQSGFTVEEHLLELVGLCPICQADGE
jgi:Fur family ferric uptake transcriptional regulator